MTKEELKIRLDERLRVYKDSPSLAVTYIDLAHLVEDILIILNGKHIGFVKEENNG